MPLAASVGIWMVLKCKGTAINLIHTEEGLAQNNIDIDTYKYNLSDHLVNVR